MYNCKRFPPATLATLCTVKSRFGLRQRALIPCCSLSRGFTLNRDLLMWKAKILYLKSRLYCTPSMQGEKEVLTFAKGGHFAEQSLFFFPLFYFFYPISNQVSVKYSKCLLQVYVRGTRRKRTNRKGKEKDDIAQIYSGDQKDFEYNGRIK